MRRNDAIWHFYDNGRVMRINDTFSPQDVQALADMHILQPEYDPEQIEIELQRGLEFERRQRERQQWKRIQDATVLGAVLVFIVLSWGSFLRWLGVL